MKALKYLIPIVAASMLVGMFLASYSAKAQPLMGSATWSCSLDGVGATLTLCKQALEPGTGHRYITDVIAQSTTTAAGLFLIRAGTGSACGTGTISVLPAAATVPRLAYSANTLAQPVWSFATPVQVPRDKDLCVIGTATNTVTIQIQGTVGP